MSFLSRLFSEPYLIRKLSENPLPGVALFIRQVDSIVQTENMARDLDVFLRSEQSLCRICLRRVYGFSEN